MAELALSPTGTLWTFTTQGFRPKQPYRGADTDESFTGFALGYVELPEGVLVQTLLTESDPAKLTIGMPMKLVNVPVYLDDDGAHVVSFAFSPTT
jgi:uncharacterized OB-fold protein